jgi:hypothetical protein
MRYWNKSKKARELHWTRVSRPRPTISKPALVVGTSNYDSIKYWCQKQKSTGRFFMSMYNFDVWFEYPEDATWFLLNWS